MEKIHYDFYPEDNIEFCDVTDALVEDRSLSPAVKDNSIAILNAHHDAQNIFGLIDRFWIISLEISIVCVLLAI